MEKRTRRIQSVSSRDRRPAPALALPANPAVRWALALALVEAAGLLIFYLRAG